ncbi:MAG: aminotransferase class V-fold PLP-dependent enzyme [Clostridia bacterium]
MIYFDNSATTRSKPLSVKLCCLHYLHNNANPGRSAHKNSIKCSIAIENTREIIQKHFFSGNVIFTKNSTEALNLAILGSDITGQVITTDLEHNSVLRPLQYLSDNKQITLKILTSENNDYLSELKRTLTNATSLVVLTGMSNVIGKILPIEQMAKYVKGHSKAKIIIDMAQGAGHIIYNYEHIDIICCSGHKGLYGLQGTGFLLAKKHIKLHPLTFGGTGISSLSLTPPLIYPESFEAGTQFTMGIVCLGVGINWTFNHRKYLQKKYDFLTNYLNNKLSSNKKINFIGGNNGVISFNIDGYSSSQIGNILSEKYHIAVRCGIHCAPLFHKKVKTNNEGSIRVSLGRNNNIFEIMYLIYILNHIMNKGV